MSIRVLVIAVCLFVAADLLLLVPLSYFFGWVFPLEETVVSAALGLLVIGYYEWRWSSVIAERLRSEESGPVGNYCLEKILLLLAGAFLILPGILSTAVGVVLLLPGVRRLVVQLLSACI